MNFMAGYGFVPLWEYTGQNVSSYTNFVISRDLTKPFKSLVYSMTTGAAVVCHGPLEFVTKTKDNVYFDIVYSFTLELGTP